MKVLRLVFVVILGVLNLPWTVSAATFECRYSCLRVHTFGDTASCNLPGGGQIVDLRYYGQYRHVDTIEVSGVSTIDACSTAPDCARHCRTQCGGRNVDEAPPVGRTETTWRNGEQACLNASTVPLYILRANSCRDLSGGSLTGLPLIGASTESADLPPRCVSQGNPDASRAPAPPAMISLGGPGCVAPAAGTRAGMCKFFCLELDTSSDGARDVTVGARVESCLRVTAREQTAGACPLGSDGGCCVAACETTCGLTPDGKRKCFVGMAPDNNAAERGANPHIRPCPGVGNVGSARPPACSQGTTASRGSSARLENPLGSGADITVLLSRLIKAMTGIAGAIALLMFVVGGVLWMTAESSERVNTAKTILKNASLGLILIFFSYSLVSLFLTIFGL